LPEGVEEIQLWDAYGVAAQAKIVDPQTIVFTAQEPIRPEQTFEVRVQFPHGIVDVPPPAWQPDFDKAVTEQAEPQFPNVVIATNPYETLMNLLAGFVGLFITVGGIVGLFLLWYLHGRDTPVALVADYLPQPPDDIPPGMVGTLLDETADMQDIIATIVDLARRKVITMQEVQDRGFMGIGARRDFIFEEQDHNEVMRPYEQTLLHQLFRSRNSVKLSALKQKFYQAIPELRDQLYEEVVNEGFFQRSPESTRNIYKVVGVVGLILSFAAGIVSLSLATVFAPAIICIPLGLGIVSIGMLILARVMPRKTTAGAEAAARWRAFRRYLENIEDYTDLEQAKDIFDKYLPYAIAFGLEKRWVQKFAEVDAPAPPWYQPAGGPVILHDPWPHDPRQPFPHSHPRPPVLIGTGGGHHDSPTSPLPDVSGPNSGGLPDLQRTSDSLSRGLQGMSDGLATMLSVAGSILSSMPSSSRSTGGFGGGWSGGGGGGFSGGGGGGSGGGSRGFG
jgi:uncharacterized membrane protein YgcG